MSQIYGPVWSTITAATRCRCGWASCPSWRCRAPTSPGAAALTGCWLAPPGGWSGTPPVFRESSKYLSMTRSGRLLSISSIIHTVLSAGDGGLPGVGGDDHHWRGDKWELPAQPEQHDPGQPGGGHRAVHSQHGHPRWDHNQWPDLTCVFQWVSVTRGQARGWGPGGTGQGTGRRAPARSVSTTRSVSPPHSPPPPTSCLPSAPPGGPPAYTDSRSLSPPSPSTGVTPQEAPTSRLLLTRQEELPSPHCPWWRRYPPQAPSTATDSRRASPARRHSLWYSYTSIHWL